MIKTQIPGWGELAIENLILDFNGTIAKDGRVLDGVKELLEKIHPQDLVQFGVGRTRRGQALGGRGTAARQAAAHLLGRNGRGQGVAQDFIGHASS